MFLPSSTPCPGRGMITFLWCCFAYGPTARPWSLGALLRPRRMDEDAPLTFEDPISMKETHKKGRRAPPKIPASLSSSSLSRLALVCGLAFCLVLPSCSPGGEGPGSGPGVDGGAASAPPGPEGEIAALLRSHRLDEAEAALQALPAAQAGEPWARYDRGRILLERILTSENPEEDPRLDEAEQLFRGVLEAVPDHYMYMARVSLGAVLGLEGELVQGVKCLEAARAIYPDRPDAYFELGRIYTAHGQIDAGVASMQKGLDKDRNRADGWMLFGRTIYFFRGQQDEGLQAMRKALELDPELPGAAAVLDGALLALAEKALGRGENEDVIRITEEVLEREPGRGDARRLQGEARLALGDTARAIEAFRAVLEADPGAEEARNDLARTLVREGYGLLLAKRKEEAYARFREAVVLQAPGVDLTVVKRILDEGGGGKKTAGPGGEGRALPPEQGPAPGAEEARTLFEQGSALLQAGKPEEALALLRKSLEILPENPFALHQAGLALHAMGRGEEAKKELRSALDRAEALKVSLPATYLKLAEIALEEDRVEEAREYLDTFAERFPERKNDPVAESLRRILLLKGK